MLIVILLIIILLIVMINVTAFFVIICVSRLHLTHRWRSTRDNLWRGNSVNLWLRSARRTVNFTSPRYNTGWVAWIFVVWRHTLILLRRSANLLNVVCECRRIDLWWVIKIGLGHESWIVLDCRCMFVDLGALLSRHDINALWNTIFITVYV